MIKLLAIAVALSFSYPNSAVATVCEGSTSYIAIEGPDYLKIDIGYGQWTVCRTSTNYTVTRVRTH